MPMVGSNPDEGAQALRAMPLRRRRRVRVAVVALGRAAALAPRFGCLWFVARLTTEELTLDRGADGIVVLTGGASRISDAIELLAAGRGKRLLISGANPSTNQTAITRLNPEFARVVGCCVDFDRS